MNRVSDMKRPPSSACSSPPISIYIDVTCENRKQNICTCNFKLCCTLKRYSHCSQSAPLQGRKAGTRLVLRWMALANVLTLLWILNESLWIWMGFNFNDILGTLARMLHMVNELECIAKTFKSIKWIGDMMRIRGRYSLLYEPWLTQRSE